MEVFQDSKWVKIVCVGGSFRKRTKSFIGTQAVNQLETLYANKAFVSCTAVNRKFGVTDDSEREAEIRRKMIANSEETFLIVDRTKFDNLESVSYTHLDVYKRQGIFRRTGLTYFLFSWRENDFCISSF